MRTVEAAMHALSKENVTGAIDWIVSEVAQKHLTGMCTNQS